MSLRGLLSGSFIFIGVSLILWGAVLPFVEATLLTGEGGIVSPIAAPTLRPLNAEPPEVRVAEPRPSSAKMSIEKLGIRDAKVALDLETTVRELYIPQLKTSVGHLKGSAYPGEWGNTFLFGHSALPLFFNPKNYLTIFATLFRLRQGDLIKVNYGGEDYAYAVEGIRFVSPYKDLESILAGPGKKLTIMTCFPPGLKTQRLLILAEMVETPSQLSYN